MMSGVFLVLGACSGHGSESMPASNNDEKILNVYAWSDYIAPAAISNFEKETGIEVRYDTYDNNEILETKLLTGHSNYDIVIPSENFFDGQLRAGVYRALDKRLLPNLVNADPEIMRRGCPSPAQCRNLDELPDAPRGERGNLQLHQIPERQRRVIASHRHGSQQRSECLSGCRNPDETGDEFRGNAGILEAGDSRMDPVSHRSVNRAQPRGSSD
jgi:hypothetical protein